jgi:hypothetical protein
VIARIAARWDERLTAIKKIAEHAAQHELDR